MAALPMCYSRLRHLRYWKSVGNAIRFSSNRTITEFVQDKQSPVDQKDAKDGSSGDSDFFGFGGEGVVEVGNMPPADMATLKAWHEQMVRERKSKEEKLYVTTYGSIRLDSQNVPTFSSLRTKTGTEDELNENDDNQEVTFEQVSLARAEIRREPIESVNVKMPSDFENVKKDENMASRVKNESYSRRQIQQTQELEQVAKMHNDEIGESRNLGKRGNRQSIRKSEQNSHQKLQSSSTSRSIERPELENVQRMSSVQGTVDQTEKRILKQDDSLSNPLQQKSHAESVLKPEFEKYLHTNDNTRVSSENYIDELCFKEYFDKDEKCATMDQHEDDLGYIDKQFFSRTENLSKEQISHEKIKEHEDEELNYIDKNYFLKNAKEIGNTVLDREELTVSKEMNDSMYDMESLPSKHLPFDQSEIQFLDTAENVLSPEVKKKPAKETFDSAFDYVKKLRQEKAIQDMKLEKMKRAADELKREGEKASGKDESEDPSTLLRRLPIDLEKMTEYEVFNILKKSIIFNDHGVVAINKPYGILCQKGEPYHHYMQRYLPDLAKTVNTDKLHVVHRLDRGTTGILLLAKDEQTAAQIRLLFKTHKIQKVYWAITKGVPSPEEGIINIPISEGSINGSMRMVLKPDLNDEDRNYMKIKSSRTFEAVTQYRVMSCTDRAALVQLQPQTGVKHQVRVHLGFGLACPILADHKYSYLTEMKPQKLHDRLLASLKIKQSRVRDLPLYLHAREIVIPEIADGRNIFIRANLSVHFKWAMQRLKLSKRRS